jgi:predicted PurR-regulated permease PerM
MTRVMLIVFLMAAVTLMGILIVAALVAGYDTLRPILVASALGFVLAIPVSWQVARAIS